MFISVILPAYNMRSYIIDCLNSIVSQIEINLNDYEVIVVNDGSLDDTLSLVKQYIKSYTSHNIKLIDKRNEGVSIARNVGLCSAIGEYIWFIDSDDCISNDAFKFIKQAISNNNPDVFAIGKVIRNVLNSDGTFKLHEIPPRVPTDSEIIPAYKLYLTNEGFNHQRFIWKREFLLSNNLHYPEYISQNEDFFFTIKSLYLAEKACVNRSFMFYYYRSNIESASRISDKYEKADKFMRNRIILLSELGKIYKQTKSSKDEKDFYFNKKIVELQANATITLMISGAPLYFIRYYLNRLKKLQCYPLNSEMINAISYYYKVFNFKYVFYLISQVMRLPIIKFIRRFK